MAPDSSAGGRILDDTNSITHAIGYSGHNIEGILALMLPIVAIIMGIGLAMIGVWLDYRRRKELFELHHKERLAAIEKGIEVPPLPVEFFENRRTGASLPPSRLLLRGLMLVFVG